MILNEAPDGAVQRNHGGVPAPTIPLVVRLLLLAAAIMLTIVAYLQPGTHLEPGLDQSWAYGINYAFYHRLVMGREFCFTFGPLGFLEHTRLLSDGMLYASSAFSFACTFLLCLGSFYLSCLATARLSLRVVNLVASAAMCALIFPQMQYLLVLANLVIFLHWITNRASYLVALSVLFAFGLYIKFSYGAALFTLCLSYVGVLLFSRRDRRSAIITVVSLVAVSTVAWWMIYGTPRGMLDYLVTELVISRGNGSAMAMNPENNWWAIGIFYLVFLAGLVLVHGFSRGRFRVFPLVFVLPLLVWTKYAFSQESSPHLYPLLDYAVFVLVLFFITADSLAQKAGLAACVLVVCMSWKEMHTADIGPPDYVNLPHLRTELPEIVRYRLKFARLFSVWRHAEVQRLESLRLPQRMRDRIGANTVDVYPWELTIAAANQLNWRPRPAIQMYIAYLPYLDQKNADFYSGPDAPEYVVWHHHTFQDILQRYPLSSDPLTVESLLRHYRLLECDTRFCLWQRAAEAQLAPAAEGEAKVVVWDTWIPVPDYTDGVLRARLAVQRTILGNLNLLAWKEGGMEIDYRFRNGEIRTHDLLIDNAASGIWVRPYLQTYPGDWSGKALPLSRQQLRTWLASADARGYLERLEPADGGWRVSGWALPAGKDVGLQQAVLLYNDQQALQLSAGRVSRPDVEAYFAAQGKPGLGDCGISEVIDASRMPPGHYHVRLAVRADDRWSVLPDQGVVVDVAPGTSGNPVTDIRVRTQRPWAFTPTSTLVWQQLEVQGEQSWLR